MDHATAPHVRLCTSCDRGAVLRGYARKGGDCDHADAVEEIICLFLGRVIEIDVVECSLFIECASKTATDVTRADTAWVA